MKSINKEKANQLNKAKQYVYSWLADGEGDTTYAISDKLSNLNFEYGTDVTDGIAAGAEVPEAVNFVHGNTSASYLKSIAAGYYQVAKNVTGEQDVLNTYTFTAPRALNVIGVDAGNIYGGLVVATDAKCSSINYTASGKSRYENVNAIVAGDRDILIEDVKAKAVYGGGAGYGSILDGSVSISLVGTNNSISNVFGGGQKGAVVTGDVSIDVSRRDAKGGRIGTIYGGGENAVVKGDVTITIHGTNAVGIGTVSGSGKGNKSEVMGDRYLVIDGFSGKFSTTIKDFDHITLTSGTAITLTQSQQKSIQSATYEFVIDQATLNQPNAMLTWNKKIDVGQFYITVADEFASNADDAFTTTIFASNQLTQQAFDLAGMKVYDEAGKEITSGYSLEFVAELDNKGKAKKKGGAIVLKFDGTNADVTGEDTTNREFTAADDDINIRGKYVSASVDAKGGNNKITLQKDSVMAGNVTAGDGNDRFTVQSGAIMAGTVALGAGENEIDVLGGGEINGAIKLADGTAEKRVKNTIDVNGSISQIEGGNEFTDNTIWIKNEKAVGYWEYDSLLGVRGGLDLALQGDVLSGEIALGERRVNFVDQDLDLTHSNGSNDTVYVTQASKWDGNINFGKGKDTLILNTPATANGPASHGTITAEDGNNVIVANQTGVTVDSDKMKLSGTDNILVVSNGVKATILGMAIGDFETAYGQFGGLFLGQNAILDDGAGNYAVESFDGSMALRGDLTVITPKDYTNPESENYSQELADRIGTFYTVGNGVNGVIDANGNNINLSKDTTVTGEIYDLNGATITLLEGAKINGTVVGAADVYFKQNAGSEDFLFENDVGEAANIRVAKNVVATVGSINGIAGTTFQGTDNFENDSALVALNEDAALYAAQDKNLLVGNITKDTDFAEKYGDMAKGTISVIDEVKARVTFTGAKVYFGNGAAFHKGITFKGANTVDVQSQKIVIDDKQLFFEGDDAKVDFNVLDGAELVFDGIVKGGTYSDKVKVNLGKNARFAYADTMETGSWDEAFNAGKLDGRTNVTFREKSLVDNKINLNAANDDLTVNIEKDSFVKGDLTVEDRAVVTLGQGEDTLNVAAARIDGQINTANDNGVKDVVNLAGSTVNGVKEKFAKDEVAVNLDAADQLFMTDKAKVNGDIVGGDLVHITDSEVTGSIEAAKNVLVGATVATIKNGDTFVESGKDASGTESKIALVDATANDVSLYADDAKATIGAFEGTTGNTIHLEARNKGTVALSNVDTTVGDVEFRAFHDGSAVDFGGDVKLVADNATFTAEEGGELKNLGNVQVDGGFTGDIKTLAGTTAAAQTATLASVNGKAITAGDVTFVADDSAINLASEGTFNTLGAIAQSGALTKDGYGRVTDAAAATKAEINAGEQTALSAKSVDQYAQTATVGVKGAMTVDGDVVQTAETKAEITLGDVDTYGTLNVGGFIVQEAAEGKALADATIKGTGDLTAAAIQQIANAAKIEIDGSTTVTDGDIKQVAQTTTAEISLKGATSIAGVLDQTAKTNATVEIDTLDEKASVASIAQTAEGEIKLDVKGDVTAGSVTQNKGFDVNGVAQKATKATVNIDGTFTGAVDQAADEAAVTFTKIAFDEENKVADGQTGIVGDVKQIGTTSAKIEDKLEFVQKYDAEKFSEALADKVIEGTITRQVGAVTQESAENVLSLGATITADGKYEEHAPNDYHKRAVVDFGNVELKAGDISQTGVNTDGKAASNVVAADIAYTAEGESNVKVGNTTLEMGSITQFSDEGATGAGVYANTVSITATQTIDAGKVDDARQSAMELGTFTGKVGAIDQTAYKASNKVVIDMEKNAAENLTVGEIGMTVDGDINMRAYGDDANNTLDLAGEVTVKGDVKVGGVIDGEAISEDSAWGDRTANKNTVTIATDTVTLEKDLTLVGMTNKLTLDNDSYFTKGDTELKQVAKNVALAGKDNTIEVAAGLKLDNIALYDLTDHDKIGGLEGYDLTDDKVYNNTIKLYGAANSLELKQKNSNDTIEIRGGNVAGDVITNNGGDSILLGNTDKDIDGAKRVMGDATIGGKVVMGTKDEAVGSNKIDMQAFAARDLANPDADVLHNVAIGKSVEMYAGAKDHTGDAKFKFDNELVMAGTVAPNPAEDITVNGERSFATATIGGGVTMVAENAYDTTTGDVLDLGTNKISMGKLTQIDGDVTMTGYTSNEIQVRASEEQDFGKTVINGYAEITGKVEMTAGKNTITVAGDQTMPVPGAAAYMNGITMGNIYTGKDGKEYLIDNSENKITVGNGNKYYGSELVVGTWDEDDGENKRSVADVKMGTVAFKKGDSELVWTIASVDKAAKGHDIIKYLGEQTALVTGLTAKNDIVVTGRFDSNDIVMMANANNITVRGDGVLSKFDAAATVEEKNKVSEEVRTASFDAGDIVQVAGLAADSKNQIVAHGNKNGVERYGYLLDGDGNVTDNFDVIAHLPNLTFKAGKITQVQYATQLDGDTSKLSNLVDLTGHIVAETGDITQQANVNNEIKVDAFAVPATDNQPIAAPRSQVGMIEQVAGEDNTVTLTRTDGKTIGQIAGNDNTVTMTDSTSDMIDQFASNDNTVTMTGSTSGDIGQTAGNDNNVKLTDSTSGAITQDAVKNNTANIDPSTVDGAIKQTSVEGWNKVLGAGAWDQADFAVDPETGKKTVEAPIYNPSVIDGSITQTAAIKNDVITTLTDINGAITQDGGLNNVNVQGAVKDVKFVEDDGTEDAFKQQVAVKLGGDITQKNAKRNEITLKEVDFGKNVDQSAKFANSFVASATATDAAENVGVSPDDTMCEYHNTNPHASSTVEVGAKFNTMDVGTVAQKVELTAADVEEGAMAYVGANLSVTDNVNVGDITQENNFATNTILVNQTTFDGKVTDMATYVGEIDNSLADVTYVGQFDLNKVTEVGAIEQTGTANTAALKGVAGSTVTQTAVAPEFVEGVAGGNKLTVTAVEDVNAVVVDTAAWDETKPGFDKEDFTKAILDGSANVRAGNTLGAITQVTAASGNFEEQVKNEINLVNTTVNGDVSQEAVSANANVKNEFTATTTAQHFVDIGKNADGELVEIAGGYNRTTQDDITGSLTQTGYENEAAVTNVNVIGDVAQTTALIDTTGHHGDQFTGTAIGGNTLNVNKDAAYVAKDAAVAETDLVAAGVEKLGEKLNVVDVAVGGKIVQTVNNENGTVEDADGKKFVGELTADNTINATLANLGEIEQTTTYGTNTIDIDSGALTGLPQELLTVGKITQSGSANVFDAQTAAATTVEQTAVAQEFSAKGIKNAATLTGSVTDLVKEAGHAGTVDDPEVILQQPLAEYASAESITQTVKQFADETLVEGKKLYNVGNAVAGAENAITATNADVVAVKQGGEGMIDNTVAFTGNARSEWEVVEDIVNDTAVAQVKSTTNENTLGKVEQTGVTNAATIQTAASVGEIVQTAASVDTVLVMATGLGSVDVYQNVSKVAAIGNTVTINDADQAGKISQTATSDAFQTVFLKNGEDAGKDPVDGVVTANNSVNLTSVNDDPANAKDIVQTINGTAGVGDNSVTASESNLGNLAQTTNWGDNTVDVDLTNMGNVTQTTVVGANSVEIDSDEKPWEVPQTVLTAGNITQTGSANELDAETTDMKAVSQTANATEDEAANVYNDVVLNGSTTPASLVKKPDVAGTIEDPEVIEQQPMAAYADADSIIQTVNKLGDATIREGKTFYDVANEIADLTENEVTATYANVGEITQGGEGTIENKITFTGNARDVYEIVTDEVADTALAQVKETIRDNTLGTVTQDGIANEAEIDTVETVGDIAQTAKTVGTVAYKHTGFGTPADVYQTISYVEDISNDLEIENADKVGTIVQAATSDTFDTEYLKNGEDYGAPKKAGVVTADNEVELTDVRSAGDVTQTITGTAGKGDNELTLDNTNVKNVIQTTTDGKNKLEATTNSTNTDELSTKIGTIDQTGVSNSVETEDVETKAITQRANGVTADDVLSNSVEMTGIVIDPAAEATLLDGADPSLPESYVFDPNGHAAVTKAESISQTATVKALETLEEVPYFDGDALASNKVELTYADAGAIVQTGNANTANEVAFEGAKAEVKAVTKVEVKETTGAVPGHDTETTTEYILTEGSTEVKENAIDTIDQTGVTNKADIKVGISAGEITQNAVSNKTIVEEVVRVQTAASQVSEDEDIKANGEFFKVIRTSVVGTISNEVVLSDVTTAGAINQSAAIEGKYNETTEVWRNHQLADGTENWIRTSKPEYYNADAVKAVTGGDLAANPELGPDKHVNGTNKVEVKDGTTVTGKITQTASGDYGKIDENVYQNYVKATGKVSQAVVTDPEEGEVAADNPQLIAEGAYLNSIGDVEQTLTSYADAFAYNAETNFIELSQINAGALKQVANGYAANLITSYPGTVVEKAVDPADGIAKDAGIAKVTIASIEQAGFINTTRLDDAQIGAAPDGGAFVAADITLTSTKVTNADGDVVIAGGLNTVALTNVEVGKIVAKTEANMVDITGDKIVIEAADASITLTDTTVTGGVFTGGATVEVDGFGSGNDTVTLYGSTKVIGDIDLGSNSYTVTEIPGTDPKDYLVTINGADTLSIWGAGVDLSEATVKGIEQLETHGTDTVSVKGIVTGNFALDTGVATINATTLDVGAITVYPDGYPLNLKTISAQADADGKLTTAVDYTFSKGLGVSGDKLTDVIGSIETGDTVQIGDGVLGEGDTKDATLYGVKMTGFESVVLKQDAKVQGVTWAKSATGDSATIAFTFADNAIGNIGNLEAYNDSDITLNGYTWDSTNLRYAAGGAWTTGSDYYTLDKTTGVLSYSGTPV